MRWSVSGATSPVYQIAAPSSMLARAASPAAQVGGIHAKGEDWGSMVKIISRALRSQMGGMGGIYLLKKKKKKKIY